MKQPDELRSQLARSMVLTTAIGLDLACALAAGIVLGLFIDARLGSRPLGLVLGTLLGLAGGAFGAIGLIKRAIK